MSGTPPSIERPDKPDKTETKEPIVNPVWENYRLKTRICQLPMERKAVEEQMKVLNNRIENMEAQKKQIEMKLFSEICGEKDELTIKGEVTMKFKYTNKESREAELSLRTQTDEKHAEIRLNIYDKQNELKTLTIEANYLRRETKAIETLIELLKID